MSSRNPFYFLLLIASLLFTITALAYALIPVMEQRLSADGRTPPPFPLRNSLLEDGWLWLLYEVAAIAVLSLLSMGLDRLRSLQNAKTSATIQPAQNDPSADS